MPRTIQADTDKRLSSLLGPDFEQGSNGGTAADAPPANGEGRAPSDVSVNARGFTGTVNISDGKALLIAGGIRAEILTAGDVPAAASLDEERRRAVATFKPYTGKTISIDGEQRNGYILRAVPRGATSSNMSETEREAFARIAEVIASRRAQLDSYPDVVNVRPGYRFRGGEMTDEPAIVVSVRWKRDPSELRVQDLIPSSIDGVPVDVAAATPEEQLRAYLRTNARVESASEVSAQLAESRMALPFYEAAARDEAAETLEALSDINYTPPPHVRLNEVSGAMSVVCHVSPDAGWPTLKSELLDRVTDRLTVAIYDFTAPHIVDGFRSTMRRAGGDLRMIFGPGASLGGETKADDLPEEKVIARLRRALSGRFKQVWAVVSGPRRIFANSYHIKVAVADGRAFWLSSGNLQSSNQPDLDPLGADADAGEILREYNREWHVVVNHPGLARTFEQFIEWDIEKAAALEAAPAETAGGLPQFFLPASRASEAEAAFVPRYFRPARFRFTAEKPLRVQPLLTPDNYARHILALIRSARERLYFQNQSLSILENNQAEFDALVDALKDKSRDPNIDVRIILRGEFGARQMLEAMRARGFDTSLVKFQDRCHNKGIIVDSEKVVVSSHNWTNSGTLFNRDAGLIFYDSGIARYYEEIFLYDWENLASRRTREEETMPVLAVPGAEPPEGAELVSWADLFE